MSIYKKGDLVLIKYLDGKMRPGIVLDREYATMFNLSLEYSADIKEEFTYSVLVEGDRLRVHGCFVFDAGVFETSAG